MTAQAQLIALPSLDDPPPDPAATAVPAHPLLQVRARLQVCVGEVTLTVGDFLDARLDQVLTLDRGVEDLVDVLLEGRVVARGQLVAVGDVFGVRLTQLPQPLKL